MAITKLNPALQQLRGKIGDLVFRQVKGKLIVSRVPDFSRRKLSARQQAQCQRFSAAVQHAQAVLADQKRRGGNTARAADKGRPRYNSIISDFLQSAQGRPR